MPLYEYRCMACRVLTEKMRRTADRNKPATCHKCGKPARRVISIPQKPVVVRMTAEQIHRDPEVWR